MSFFKENEYLLKLTSVVTPAEPPDGSKTITRSETMKPSAIEPSQECSVSHTNMAYKSLYNKAINRDVPAQNDERKLNRGCLGCKYLAKDYTCRYSLDTKRSRAAQGIKKHPNGGCDLYSGTKHKMSAVLPGIVTFPYVSKKLREISRTDTGKPIDHEAAMNLYNKGAVDSQIAASLGVTKQAVCDWRKVNDLESNYLKFRKENPT